MINAVAKNSNTSIPNTLDRNKKERDRIFESLCAAIEDANVTKQTAIDIGSHSKPSRKIALIVTLEGLFCFGGVQ